MNSHSSRACVLTLAAICALAAAMSVATAAGGSEQIRRLEWDQLMPADWNPFDEVEQIFARTDTDEILDDTAEADRLMREYRAAVAFAPVVGALDGQRVQLPGFIVPLEYDGREITEFLLVPYFGACIHTPPPPSNQVVFVRSAEAYPLRDISEPVWVTGTLSTQAVTNDVGDAGYTLRATKVEPYDE